ncbi:MAG: alkene reductase [Bdellovibrionales bacterium]|nr:alkene reductase [Bdellovibrionales bacterium]
MNHTSPLLSPLLMGSIELRNRMVLAPLTRGRAGHERLANRLMAEYYTQRAGAGLLITEATVVSQQGIGWVDSPGIYNDEQAEAWKLVTESVHKKGTPIFMQLWHCGRASHSSFFDDGSLPVAPSAIKIENQPRKTPLGDEESEVPRALETKEIALIVQDYRAAARRALDAGFDGVEVHAANGYLIDQFLQSKSNQRSDAYGGSIENRYRFLGEVLSAVLEVFPAHKVGVRLSPNGVFNDMGSPDFREQFLYVAEQLAPLELAYLHVLDGLAFGFHQLGEPLTLKDFKAVYPGILMANCGYTKEAGEEVVQAGHAELVSYGRPFINNPDLVERFANDYQLNETYDMSTWYSGGSKGYTDFPTYASGSES